MKAQPLKAVRLTDVPITQRLRAARVEGRTAADNAERLSLLAAAIAPSDRVYWIRAA